MSKKIRIKTHEVPDRVLPLDLTRPTRLGLFPLSVTVAPVIRRFFQRLEDLGFTMETAAATLKDGHGSPLGPTRLRQWCCGVPPDINLFTLVAYQLGFILTLQENPHHDENQFRAHAKVRPPV